MAAEHEKNLCRQAATVETLCPFMTHIKVGKHHSAIVDVEDWLEQSKFHWQLHKSKNKFYITRKKKVNGKRITVYLHREISKPETGFETHHVNKDTFDNRRENHLNLTPEFHRFIDRCGKL